MSCALAIGACGASGPSSSAGTGSGDTLALNLSTVPTDPRAKALPIDMIFVDLPKYLDEGEKWSKLFQDTFVNQAR